MKQAFKQRYPDLVRILRLLILETRIRAADLAGRLSPRQRIRLRSLRRAHGLQVNIGCGRSTKSGWVNIDVSPAADVRMDLRRRLPFEEGTVRYIFTEHFCDHLGFPDVIGRFLKDCFRVLEPHGVARFVVHDVIGLMRACVEHDRRYFEIGQEIHETDVTAVNYLMRMNDMHQFLYDFETFERLLRRAGFGIVRRCKYLESSHPDLVLDFEHPHREMLSMYIEAEK